MCGVPVNKHYLFFFISQLMRKLIETFFHIAIHSLIAMITDRFIPSRSSVFSPKDPIAKLYVVEEVLG